MIVNNVKILFIEKYKNNMIIELIILINIFFFLNDYIYLLFIENVFI